MVATAWRTPYCAPSATGLNGSASCWPANLRDITLTWLEDGFGKRAITDGTSRRGATEKGSSSWRRRTSQRQKARFNRQRVPISRHSKRWSHRFKTLFLPDQFRTSEQLIEPQQTAQPGTLLVFLQPLFEGGLDNVTPGSSCVANAYTNNHDKLAQPDIGWGAGFFCIWSTRSASSIQ
ncbi:protein of unknown function [Candidatus Filomicrobium marinum]|uniref:Uncharacterized protein n=1 Tax=Candidatus Filomicrobium marinum TaxID=1608628 RepID=A0A0D6JK41_9HYPH|nr:protein of unknown function [Candidatus Filomicrobium marinum]CPR22354.1 protein of unknown function [Candidatus Filomicrobium marinum]